MEPVGQWCLIESDPAVFTELIKKFGVKGAQVEELYSLDREQFNELKPIHGFIFLVKLSRDSAPAGPVVTDERIRDIYFAKQMISNACATQAVISILLNCDHPDIDLGPELTRLKEFSMSFDPSMRGLTLTNSEVIRVAHNSMAQQPLVEVVPGTKFKPTAKEDDVYHFLCYLPHNGRLYELDGLQEGPIDHGPIAPNQDWLDVVIPVIQKRMNAYAGGEIRFNLMALVSNRKMLYERELMEYMCDAQLLGDPSNKNTIMRLQRLIAVEDAKALKQRQEMSRRKQNYLPFIVELLQRLVKEKKIDEIMEEEKERAVLEAQAERNAQGARNARAAQAAEDGQLAQAARAARAARAVQGAEAAMPMAA